MPFRDIIISFASSGETAIKRTISVHLIDYYSYSITKSSNGAAAIGHPTDHPPINGVEWNGVESNSVCNHTSV